MQINTQGRTRIAIIGKRFTLKIPRIQLRQTYRTIKGAVKGKRFEYLRYFLTAPPGPLAATARYLMFQGISANLTEFLASKKLGDVVVPTHFSLLGLFNVMSTALPHGADKNVIWKKLIARVGEKPLYRSHHTFSGGDNYGIHDGKIKMLDYGSKGVVKTLLEFRRQFREVLDEVAK